MHRMLLLFCFLFIVGSINAQSPYQITGKKESVFIGIGAISYGWAYYLHTNVAPLTATEIDLLNRSTINAFDRKATFNYSADADLLSDVLLASSGIVPFLVLAPKTNRKDFIKVGFLFGETFLITYGLTNLTKHSVLRPRPFVFNENVELSTKQTKKARYAFFSGHTSVTTANYFLAAQLFSDYFPDSKWKRVVWGGAIIIPALTGYFRTTAGKHYPTDVIAGYGLGALVGILVPRLHKVKKNDKVNLNGSLNGIVLTINY